MLSINTKAPDFSALDQASTLRTLTEFNGQWLILYFYPKDATPGCTAEACSLRDSYHELQKMGVTIVGVSKDSVSSHQKFAQKFDLNFPLLADVDTKICQAYEALGKKKFMGREYIGVLRITYIISPIGKIAKTYENVNPLDHASHLIKDLLELQKQV